MFDCGIIQFVRVSVNNISVKLGQSHLCCNMTEKLLTGILVNNFSVMMAGLESQLSVYLTFKYFGELEALTEVWFI